MPIGMLTIRSPPRNEEGARVALAPSAGSDERFGLRSVPDGCGDRRALVGQSLLFLGVREALLNDPTVAVFARKPPQSIRHNGTLGLLTKLGSDFHEFHQIGGQA